MSPTRTLPATVAFGSSSSSDRDPHPIHASAMSAAKVGSFPMKRLNAAEFTQVLGDELRWVRKRRRWYQKDVVARLRHELSEQTLAAYETGVRRMTVVRLVELTMALDVSAIDVLARVYNRVLPDNNQAHGWTVDLVAASQMPPAELAPLRRWATGRLATIAEGAPKTALLSVHAIDALALLCDMDANELVRWLPQPGLPRVRA